MRNAVLLAFVCRIYILSSDPAGLSQIDLCEECTADVRSSESAEDFLV